MTLNNPSERGPIIRPRNRVAADKEVDGKKIAQFVTTIKNAEQQVGEHIIQALQHDDTVAVLTTVAVGQDGQQCVISAALNPERMKQVQEILLAAEQEREEEEPCFGFHCLVKPKNKKEDENVGESSNEASESTEETGEAKDS